MNAILSATNLQAASRIPEVTADEAFTLMQTSFERFMTVIESLEADDWDNPTACTAWDVHDMVAHQAGGYVSGTGYREMFRQYRAIVTAKGLPEDAINAMQVAGRADRSPTELIAELRAAGPTAIRKWAYEFRLAKAIVMPHAIAGWRNVRYLMWVIHSRDTWMHRLDICRATGRPFEQTPEHDGRIAALVMMDVEKALSGKLRGRSIVFELSGTAGGAWKFGAGEPAATVQMDALEFNIFVSGRTSFEEARKLMTITGDAGFAEGCLNGLLILY